MDATPCSSRLIPGVMNHHSNKQNIAHEFKNKSDINVYRFAGFFIYEQHGMTRPQNSACSLA
jgi:hypothetical protein